MGSEMCIRDSFDIVKPFGIRRFDEIKTDWAVLVDDVVAGVYANIALRIILLLIAWQQGLRQRQQLLRFH